MAFARNLGSLAQPPAASRNQSRSARACLARPSCGTCGRGGAGRGGRFLAYRKFLSFQEHTPRPSFLSGGCCGKHKSRSSCNTLQAEVPRSLSFR